MLENWTVSSLPWISFAWGIIHGEWWTLSRNILGSAVQHVRSGWQEWSWEQLDKFSSLHIWMLLAISFPMHKKGLQSSCNLVANFYQLLVRSLCIWMLVAINRLCNFFPYQLQGNPRQSLNNLCIWFWKLSESRCVIWVWYWPCSSIGFWSKQAFVLACVIYCFLLVWLPALTLFSPLVTNSYFFSLLQLASPLQLPKQNLELESQLLFLNYFYT